MTRISISLLLIFSLNLSALCQTDQPPVNSADSLIETSTVVPSELYEKYFGKIDSLHNDYSYMRSVKVNPFYYKIYLPLIYYYSPIEQITESIWERPQKDSLQIFYDEVLPIDENRFTEIKRINRQINPMLLNLYVKHPEWVVTTESKIQSRNVFREDIGVTMSKKASSIMGLFKPEEFVEDVSEGDVLFRKPNFWVKGGSGAIKFSQNYISENWYKGGESNNQLYSEVKFYMNYNDKKWIHFDNSLEIRIGFNSVPSDTIRKYRIDTDVFRLNNKLGIWAGSKWYYTLSSEFNTQFFNNYKANSQDVKSAFFAPINLGVSLGMDYKLKKNRIDLSAVISPFSYNLKFVGDSRVDETQFGIEKGKRAQNDFGSKVFAQSTWKIISSVEWITRFNYFTNYARVEVDWENTIRFKLNKYLSTDLFVHARFDDNVELTEENTTYYQLKEYLSLAISYAW